MNCRAWGSAGGRGLKERTKQGRGGVTDRHRRPSPPQADPRAARCRAPRQHSASHLHPASGCRCWVLLLSLPLLLRWRLLGGRGTWGQALYEVHRMPILHAGLGERSAIRQRSTVEQQALTLRGDTSDGLDGDFELCNRRLRQGGWMMAHVKVMVR
jgi:hypothetical protein